MVSLFHSMTVKAFENFLSSQQYKNYMTHWPFKYTHLYCLLQCQFNSPHVSLLSADSNTRAVISAQLNNPSFGHCLLFFFFLPGQKDYRKYLSTPDLIVNAAP